MKRWKQDLLKGQRMLFSWSHIFFNFQNKNIYMYNNKSAKRWNTKLFVGTVN